MKTRIANKMRRFVPFAWQESGTTSTVQVLLFCQQRTTTISGEDIFHFGDSVLVFRSAKAR
jgi:hypothetical protein